MVCDLFTTSKTHCVSAQCEGLRAKSTCADIRLRAYCTLKWGTPLSEVIGYQGSFSNWEFRIKLETTSLFLTDIVHYIIF